MTVEIEIWQPPEDYNHPKDNRIFRIGDRVVARDGRGTVTAIFNGYYNRADQWVNMENYQVDYDTRGSAIMFGYQLNSDVTPPIGSENDSHETTN